MWHCTNLFCLYKFLFFYNSAELKNNILANHFWKGNIVLIQIFIYPLKI